MTELSLSENIIDTNGKVFLFGLLLTIVEIPFIYFFIWKKILKNIAENMAYDEKEIPLCGFFSFIALPIVFTSLNMMVIDSLNESLDKSQPIKRYLAVTHSYSKAMSRSRGDHRTDTHYMELTSWISKKPFTVRITRKEFENTNPNDVYEAITRSGFFRFNYYQSLKRIDKSIFPDGTKFPLNEEQAAKLKEEKALQDLGK